MTAAHWEVVLVCLAAVPWLAFIWAIYPMTKAVDE